MKTAEDWVGRIMVDGDLAKRTGVDFVDVLKHNVQSIIDEARADQHAKTWALAIEAAAKVAIGQCQKAREEGESDMRQVIYWIDNAEYPPCPPLEENK